jgi:hypothetical protein
MLTKMNTPHRVSVDLGDGTFAYQGVQATDCAELMIWRFWMYGGVIFGGDPKVPDPASLAVAVTGPTALVQKLKFKSAVSRRRSLKIGRNECCPCGSGKKYKKCCGVSVDTTSTPTAILPLPAACGPWVRAVAA